MLVSAFIHVTGGITSNFSSLYLLPIIAASMIRRAACALQVAALSAVLYLALVLVQYVDVGAACRWCGGSRRSWSCRRSASPDTPWPSI